MGVLEEVAKKFGFGAGPTPTPSIDDMVNDYSSYNEKNPDLNPTEYMLKVMGKKRGEPGYSTSEEIIDKYLKFQGNTSASAKDLELLLIEAMQAGKGFAPTKTPVPSPTPTPDWLKESDVDVDGTLNYIKTPTPRR